MNPSVVRHLPKSPSTASAHAQLAKVCVVSASNNDQVLSDNLLRSPMIHSGQVACWIARSYASASLAYNAALEVVEADIVIFVHQDVYLPQGWEQRLLQAITWLNKSDPNWAVLGAIGSSPKGQLIGRVWSTGYNEIGQAVDQPTPTVSLDELLLVLRRDAGVRFDPNLTGYHLYGTDLVCAARKLGRSAYVFHAPAIHNTIQISNLDRAYAKAYRFMRAKWRAMLPIPTPVVALTRTPWPLCRRWFGIQKRLMLGPPFVQEYHPDVQALAQELGYALPAELNTDNRRVG